MNLINTCKNLYENLQNNIHDKKSMQKAHTVLKETVSWLYSVNAFYKKVDTTYSDAFPDLAKPLQSSISQTVYSITSLKDLIRELIVKIEQGPFLSEAVTDLMVYPNNIPKKDSKEIYLNRFVSSKFMQLLNTNVSGDDTFASELECME